jgi:hypothetical protein
MHNLLQPSRVAGLVTRARIVKRQRGMKLAMFRIARGAIMAAAACSLPLQVDAQELAMLSAAEARPLLSSVDPFIARMTAFDRAARMKTDREVSTSEYLAFAAADARDWNGEEKRRLTAAYSRVRRAVDRLALPLPGVLSAIKTSGTESAHAAYTRGSAIILPEPVLALSEPALEVLLAHELFHIFSRANPDLSERLYRAIGFVRCGPFSLPEGLSQSLVTNPDQPEIPYCIEVAVGSDLEWVTPILLPKFPFYDPMQGGEYVDYMDFRLFVAGSLEAGAPRFVRVGEVSGFFEQVGENTDYVIHPEEILAENFAMLVTGRGQVRSPEVLRQMQSGIAGFRASPGDDNQSGRMQ